MLECFSVLLVIMYAPIKNKGPRKIKEKTKRKSIEEGIPEVPQISDFKVTDYVEPLSPENETTEVPVCNVENKIHELVLEGNENEQEEKKSFLVSESQIGSERQSSTDDELEKYNLGNVSYSQINQCEPDIDNANTIGTKIGNLKKTNVFNEIKNESEETFGYQSQATTVKTCIENIDQPSAPAAGDVTAVSHSVKNLQYEDKSLHVEKPVDVSKYNFTVVVEDTMTPFSDKKLSEFYFNSELYESESFVNEFINQETNNDFKGNNFLYNLLVKYMQSKTTLKVNEAKVQDLKKKLSVSISTMWTVWDDVKVTEKEKCTDGNTVEFVDTYTMAQFKIDIFQEYNLLLKKIKQAIYEDHIMDAFMCSILKLRIEYHLQCLLTSCPEFTNLEEESPTVLSSSSLNSHFQQCLSDLKIAISVLFIFQRKQTLDIDNSFLQETRQWLSDLISILLRVGNWKDHIFLLSHLMRCPGGVSHWAAHFVQLPFSNISVDPFSHSELNHMMTVMSILLSPVKQRENFIKKWESDLVNDLNPWTVIDSDGEMEDDGDQQLCLMKENDLVSFLNQIPFADLFKTLLNCGDTGPSSHIMTSDYILKLFSFFTDFIKILLSGLKLYSNQKCRQFTKRLGRLIYHTVQYATDALILFKSKKVSESEEMRVQVEYDNFFLRSAKFIYSAKKHGTWQFLATVPYCMASSNTILKLYGILQLHDDQEENVVKINFSSFEDKFLQFPEEEQFYLLTTFANMALARDIVEIQFIKNVLLQLFYIGFLSSATMDHCYKNVKSLLCSICSSHPFLISEILFIQKNMFLFDPAHDQKLSIYLWSKLALNNWCPDKKDLEILASWLAEPIQSVQNELARIILQSLNYGIVEGKLFIPQEYHRSIAMMILKSHAKLVSDMDAGVITNVSNLVRSPGPEQTMNDWTWNVSLKLRLHLLDQSEAEICRCLHNLGDYLQSIPDVESDTELLRLVLKKHPVGCFIALMTTTLGHSVPIIFNKGFELVEVLLNSGKYEAGIACLEHMTLLLLDCSDSLQKCEKFIFLLSRLIAADNSYVQFAKNLISSNFPGPVLKSVESMLQNQLNCCRTLNSQKFINLIELWLLSLTRLPLWMQEPGILYLVDKLLQNSFFDGSSAKAVTAILEDILEANSPPSETKSSLSTLVSWMNSKYNPPSLLPKGFNGEVPWFAYKIIQMEYEIYEKKSFIWVELLKELYSNGDKKTNVDNSLKKVCNHLRVPVRSSSVLAIYKWSYQILETDISHPLTPLLWQRFFSLYLFRISGLTDRGSIGVKFFDGVINQGLFRRLKQRLQETLEHFKTAQEQFEDEINRHYYLRCFTLFQTYSLWIDDPRLHDSRLNIHMLPIQYNPELLGLLIHGSEIPWIEYLEYQNIEQDFRKSGLMWLKLRNRQGSEKGKKVVSHKKEKSQTEKINERINSYEAPLPPPRVSSKKYGFPRVNLDTLMNSERMILFVKPHLKVLLNYLQQYTADLNENIALGCDLQELLPRLYLTSETRKVLKKHCTGVYRTLNGKSVHYSCSGPAFVKLTYEESKLNVQVKQHFEHCEKAFEKNIEKATSSLPSALITSAVLIDIAIEELKLEYSLAKSRDSESRIANDLKTTGVRLFYEFIKTWCESITHTPPLKEAFEGYIEVLGTTFVEGNAAETKKILHLILGNDTFGEKISRYYTPNALSVHDFIENYSTTLRCSSKKRLIILSKFDLICWLTGNKKPKFSERSRIISTVGRGLKAVNGSRDEKETLQLLNQHLQALLMFDFPEHYGEILNFLIEASESQSISVSTWFMFLNSLTCGCCVFVEGRNDQNSFEPGQSVKKLKYYFSKFATEQNLIPFEVIKGTIVLLASTFKTERLKVGAYGLYRKYRPYVEPIAVFFGMLSYSCVAKALEIDTGSLSDKIAQQLWPLISDLYSPWLVPSWVEGDGTQDQIADRCVLLPWALNDSCHASFFASIFSESIRFVLDALPGHNQVFSYTWFFYVNNFANIYAKDFVLNVIHENLLSLPWETFAPSLQDVELMLKVVDQFLPLPHSFLGSVFVKIKWSDLVQYYSGYYDLETSAKLHICLLHLLVKLPLEPSLKQNEKVTALLTEANDYAWHLVDSNSYDAVLNWFIMSCDPRIILMDERLEYYELDSQIFNLLQTCAGYVTSAKSFHPTTLSKRLMFVRACVKWLITSNRRFKSKDSFLFKSALCRIWSDMETVIGETVPPHQRVDEAGILLAEFFCIFAEPELSSLVEATLSEWLTNRRCQVITFGLFRSAGISVENPKIFGSIIESSLENYFSFSENCDWSEVTSFIVSFSKSKSDTHLEKILIDNNNFLTLHAILFKRFHRDENEFTCNVVLTDLLQLLSEVKPSTALEPKLILLIVFGLKLVENEMRFNVKEGISFLIRLADMLNSFVNDKVNGFLSAIGLKKSASSNRFKLICLVACGGIYTFLKSNHPEYQESIDDKVLQVLDSADKNKAYQNIQQYASYAKTAVKEISSVEQIVYCIKHIGLKLFNKLYLK